MKPAAVVVAALLCTALAACRSAGWHQFQMQAADRDVVVAEVGRIAAAHGMTACPPHSDIAGAISCHQVGNIANDVSLGARQVDALVVVDLAFQAPSGIDLYDVLAKELRIGLRRTCGSANVKEPDPGQEILFKHDRRPASDASAS